MKKTYWILILLLVTISASAKNLNGVKIYVNPGHGGFDGANDRNVVTIPFAQGDVNGFWESSSNLAKALDLKAMLEASGATVIMSRTENRDEDDRPLSEIAAEANANNVDAFISIHSNAIGNNKGTNYVLLLFHGYDNEPTVEASKPMSLTAWPRFMDNQLTYWSHYTTSANCRGDFSFYGNTMGLGVLRPLTVPGFLSEGSFHDYNPETHRLLNKDYKKLEATNIYRYFCDYFKADLPSKGVIAGYVKGNKQSLEDPNYVYKAKSDDQWLPLNEATIKLMNSKGELIDTYTTDKFYNGIFAFHDLEAGTYKLLLEATEHTSKEAEVVVEASKTSFVKTLLDNPNLPIDEELPADYPDPEQELGVQAMPLYNFEEKLKQEPDWLQENNIKQSLYYNGKWYVLTKDPKILIINAKDNVKIGEMKLDGIEGGMEILHKMAFTSDGQLVACNKETINLPEEGGRYFKVYKWENDAATPTLLFQTQQQGRWTSGVVGEAFAVSGASWKCSVYTSSVTTGSSKQIRILGFLYDHQKELGHKYMMNTAEYTELLWGENFNYTTSPLETDRLIIDGEKISPREFLFDWETNDRAPLVSKGVFAEKDGYELENIAGGNFFFKHAKHSYMLSPNAKADSTATTCVLFDITNGIDQAQKVSEVLPVGGLVENKTHCMNAAAWVDGYDINLMILASSQGIAHYTNKAGKAIANIYASELKVESMTDSHKFSFTLNENSNDTYIEFSQNDEIIKSIELGALTKGEQSVTLANNQLPEGKSSWAIVAQAASVDRPTKISDNTMPQIQFNSPRGVAVDNNFDSEHFGRIYVSETVPGATADRTTQDGIYILNSALEDVTKQGANSYHGDVTWGAGSSPMRLAVAPDGKVYVTDWTDINPGVWIMDPANPSAKFKPVFDGLTKDDKGLSSKNGVNVHGSIVHCWITGTGTDTQLFTFDEDYIDEVATKTGNLLQYNIGELTTPWQSAPSKVIYNNVLNGTLQLNMNSCIAPDGIGGWWISQYRATDEEKTPSLIHIGKDGLVDFNSGKTPGLLENSYTAGMAISMDGKRIAIGCNNEMKILDITYSDKGVPSLTKIHSIKPLLGQHTTGISFDHAGNLYAVSFSTKLMGVWAMPKVENTFTTPAPKSQTINIKPIGIDFEEAEKQDDMAIYPNPVENEVNIECNDAIIYNVSLYGMRGELIRNVKANTSHIQLDMGNLDKGVYILKIQTNKKEQVRRIMKL